MAFLQSWEKQGSKNVQLNNALKKLHQTAVILLKYVPFSANPADPPSSILSDLDCMLSRKAWQELEKRFGPYTIDLMSLNSNAQIDSKGKMLRHFTPLFTPHSSGVNIIIFCSNYFGSRECLCFSSIFTRWSTSEIFAGIQALLHYRHSQALPSPVLVAYPDLSQPCPFTTGKQKGCGNSPLSFMECKFCYSSTSLGPFRLQSSEWKIDIFLSFSLSPDNPEFGDWPSHVHNVLISTMTHLTFVRDLDLEKIQLL